MGIVYLVLDGTWIGKPPYSLAQLWPVAAAACQTAPLHHAQFVLG